MSSGSLLGTTRTLHSCLTQPASFLEKEEPSKKRKHELLTLPSWIFWTPYDPKARRLPDCLLAGLLLVTRRRNCQLVVSTPGIARIAIARSQDRRDLSGKKSQYVHALPVPKLQILTQRELDTLDENAAKVEAAGVCF